MIPESRERQGPISHGLDAQRLEPIEALPPLRAPLHETGSVQDPQLLGDRRLPKSERVHQVAHASLALGEQLDDPPPRGAGDGLEDVGMRCSSDHAAIIIGDCLYVNTGDGEGTSFGRPQSKRCRRARGARRRGRSVPEPLRFPENVADGAVI